jgi:hypothetical protein
LSIGRIVGGISTSLLFSVFDSWVVSESQLRGIDGEKLGATFSLAYFGSSIAAIAAGQFGEIAANAMALTEIGGGIHYGGYITPFDLANCFLVLCMFIISSNWSENYGQNSGGGSNFAGALQVIAENKQVALCGLVASSFESSMFIFVFNWTPCLMEEGSPPPPFGHIFSCFMIMCMLGSRIYTFLSGGILSVEQIALLTMVIAGMSHATIVMTSDLSLRFFAFLAFEMCVGLYFPALGTLKGDIVPEDKRSTIYNIYRVPLNVAVLLPLLLNFSITTTFIVTTAILGLATACAFLLMQTRENEPKSSSKPKEMEDVVIGQEEAQSLQDESA